VCVCFLKPATVAVIFKYCVLIDLGGGGIISCLGLTKQYTPMKGYYIDVFVRCVHPKAEHEEVLHGAKSYGVGGTIWALIT